MAFARGSLKRLATFVQFSNDPDNRKHGAEAGGFLEAFNKFDTYFKLEILRVVFTIIEDSNTARQGMCLNFCQAEVTIHLLEDVLQNARSADHFLLFWEGALKAAETYHLDEPILFKKEKGTCST